MEPSVSKVTVGMKYLSGRFASDINVDTIAKKYTSCAVVSVMLGKYELQGAAAYRYKSCVVSASCSNNCSVLNTALYAEPYKNVSFGATCKLSLTEKVNPAIAFGVRIKSLSVNEARVKIDTEGKIGLFYKWAITKSITGSVTGSMDFNDLLNGSHRLGCGLEVRI